MTGLLRIVLRPAFNRRNKRLCGRFIATLNGRQLCVSREPLLAAARILLGEGADPRTSIVSKHAGSNFDAMISTVGAAARLTVREDETRSPHLVPYKALSCADVPSPVRFGEWPVPNLRLEAGRIHTAADRVLA